MNRYSFCNIQNELHIGIVVVVRTSWHRYIIISQLDVLGICLEHRDIDQLTHISSISEVTPLVIICNCYTNNTETHCATTIHIIMCMAAWLHNITHHLLFFHSTHTEQAQSILTFKSSGVTITCILMALSLPNASYDHLLHDLMNLTAPIPLLAIKIFSITLFPP